MYHAAFLNIFCIPPLQNFCPGFMESNKEHRLETEENLTNADPIMWTKGEILGKGAYGTVNHFGSTYIQ